MRPPCIQPPSIRLRACLGLLPLLAALGCGGSPSAPVPSDYRISGMIDGLGGGIDLSLQGPVTLTATTSASGAYAFAGLVPGSYVLRPVSSRRVFRPTERVVEVADRDLSGVDFSAFPAATVSGRITGSAVAGITVGIDPTFHHSDLTAVTDAAGNFSFPTVAVGSRYVEPISPEWRFEPPYARITVEADVGNVTFALVEGARLTGTVTGVASPVLVDLLPFERRVTTGAGGEWLLGSVADGRVTVAPLLYGYTFEPTSRTVTVAGTDVPGLDFTARRIPVCQPADLAQQNPAPTADFLLAVWGSAPDDVWAVGRRLVHWDGASWATLPIDCPGYLTGLWGSARDDVWAVGGDGLILHWDGTAWTEAPSPVAEDLWSIWGSSATDVWAGSRNGLILHWDGTAWSSLASGTQVNILGIWGSGPSDVWAVGWDTILHWDGSAWSPSLVVPSPGELSAIWGSGPRDVWVTGFHGLLHWDGVSWSDAGASFPRSEFMLDGLWGTGPGDVWAVSRAGFFQWNGSSWRSALDPMGGHLTAHAAWGLDASHAWAVGSDIAAWDGSTWRSAASGWREGLLTSTWGFGADQAWAAGNGAILGWDGTAWKPAPLPTGLSPAQLRSIWGSGPADVWAGGAGGLLLHTTGDGWVATAGPTAAEIGGIWGNGGTLWVAAGSAVFRRAPGGAWEELPTGGTYDLHAISGSGPDDVWVGARGELLHWDGTAFQHTAAPISTLVTGVSAVSPTEAWAIQMGGLGLAMRWDGTRWNVEALPGFMEPYAICASGPGDAWVAGKLGEVAHWDGTGWSRVASGTGADLHGLACGGGQVRAVGERGAIVGR